MISQPIVGVSTYWDDNFKEWIIFAPDKENDGSMQMVWELRNDWSEWEFDFMGIRGNIELPRKNDDEFWELRADGETIIIRTIWRGDKNEWRISDGSIRLEVRTRYNNLGDEWIVEDRKYGSFNMFTEWEGDPRDWIIEDNLNEEVSLQVRIAIIHIALMQSVPRT